jgi:RimJ/RimL family protein N-acetyltransferase
LELLTERHLDAVGECMRDPEVLRFTRFPAPPEDGYPRRWLDRYLAGRRDGTLEAFAALDPSEQFLGLALAVHIDAEAAEVELGYLVAPGARGRGVGSELLRQLSDWAFANLEALRLSLIIDVANLGSQQVARNAGYQHEGTLRSTYFKGGLRSDVQIWARLRSDPAPAAGRR